MIHFCQVQVQAFEDLNYKKCGKAERNGSMKLLVYRRRRTDGVTSVLVFNSRANDLK